jgi:ABC-type uncharacterized transport system YnjBCD substrate-binding protein
MSSYKYFLDHAEERKGFFNDWSENYKFEFFQIPSTDYMLVAYNITNKSLFAVMQDLIQITHCLTEDMNVRLMQISINEVSYKSMK